MSSQVPQAILEPSITMPTRIDPAPWPVVPKAGRVKIEVMVDSFPGGDFDMVEADRAYNQYFIAGCGLITLVGVIALAGLLIFLFVRDWQAAQYPGSIPISNHSNYQGLPFEYRWDNSYRTSGNFTDVYNWYSITFDLGAEARAISECILLEGMNARWLFNRRISVFLCDTHSGQMIYVTRSTSLTGRSAVLNGVENLRRSLSFAKPHLGGQ